MLAKTLSRGRGRTPTQRPAGFLAAANVTAADDQYFLRDRDKGSIDSVAFHYSIYRALARILGMDGNLQVAFDTGPDFVDAWNEIFVTNDMFNPSPLVNAIDPRHMYGTSNFDIFRWQSLENGTQKVALGTFINSLLMPGIPLVRIEFDIHPTKELTPGLGTTHSSTTARNKTSTCSTMAPATTSTGKRICFHKLSSLPTLAGDKQCSATMLGGDMAATVSVLNSTSTSL